MDIQEVIDQISPKLQKQDNGLLVGLVTLTPAMQRVILERAGKSGFINRRVSKAECAMLANVHRSGRWDSKNGTTISLDFNWVLIDGQHRLESGVLADLPITTLLVVGVDQSSFTTIDAGRVKTTKNFLESAGISNANECGTATKLYVSYTFRQSDSIKTVLSAPVDKALLVDLFQGTGILQEAVRAIKGPGFAWPRPGTAAFCWAICVEKFGDRAREFFDLIKTKTSLPGTLPFLLRERMDDERHRAAHRRSHVNQYELTWLILHACQAYAEDRKLSRLQLPRARSNESDATLQFPF